MGGIFPRGIDGEGIGNGPFFINDFDTKIPRRHLPDTAVSLKKGDLPPPYSDFYNGNSGFTLFQTQKEPTTIRFYLMRYRLCVLASGSLITYTFNFCTLINVSCLHFGQNRGTFLSSVSVRILILVLFPHIGHKIYSVLFINNLYILKSLLF